MFDQVSIFYKAIGLIAVSYLCGSIPFGYILGRMKGIDLREHGSKNIGATNAGRVLGKQYFVLVFLLDAMKGFLPTLLAGHLLIHPGFPRQASYVLWLLVASCAIIGHNWPCWLKFKGGKGVSTSLGVVLAIYPYYTYPGLIALATWIILVKISGYVSLGSIVGAAVFVASYIVLFFVLPNWYIRDQWPLLAFASVLAALLIARHSANIQRLRKGTENKFSLG